MSPALFALWLAIAVPCHAQSPLVYGEGEEAPSLHVGKWVRGEPITRLERGKVYLVEFWASWCAASQRAIPRLSTLQSHHPEDLIVIAISSRDLQGESLDRLASFVSERGDEISFRVGFDDRRRTAREWLDAFDIRSIPTVFLVNREGTIAWIGNPLWPPGELEEAAARVLAGPFTPADRVELRRRHLERRERINRAERELDDIDRAAQPDRALRLLDLLLELNPDGAGAYAFRKFEILLSTPNGLVEAYRLAREASEGVLKNDPERLRSIAWTILEEPGLARRDLDLALSAVERAALLTRRRDADVLDTLALVYARRGEPARAVEAQRLALQLATEEFVRSEYEARLKEYERAAEGTH